MDRHGAVFLRAMQRTDAVYPSAMTPLKSLRVSRETRQTRS